MYQGIEHNFSQMGLYEQAPGKKLPPAVAPKPKKHNAAPAPYRPGGSSYRAFNKADDEFPPPPPPQVNYAEDIQVFPPPPPLEDDVLPPPPPPQIPQPQASQTYGRQSPADQSSLNYRTASPGYSTGTSPGGYSSQTSPGYSGQTSPGYSSQVSPRYDRQSPEPARTASPAGHRSYSPTVRSYDVGNEYSSTSMYQRDQPSYNLRSASPVGRSPPYNPSSNQYANLPVYSSSPPGPLEPSHYARPVSTSSEGFSPRFEQERPVPGPQVPNSPTNSAPGPASPGLDKGGNKEAELDALTSLLMQNMESSKEPDYFGMCTRCNKKVMGENNGCTINDQVYHITCFSCLTCGTLLQGKSFYSMDSKPYCEVCYINTLERCSVCSKPITDRLLRATGKPYHPACFTCVVCGISLDGIPFTVDATNQIHCIEDFHKKFAPRCCVCQQPIMPETGQDETVRVVALDRSFHVQCYRCEDCGLQLSSEAEGRGCYPLDEHILCKHCNAKRIQAMTTKMTTEL